MCTIHNDVNRYGYGVHGGSLSQYAPGDFKEMRHSYNSKEVKPEKTNKVDELKITPQHHLSRFTLNDGVRLLHTGSRGGVPLSKKLLPLISFEETSHFIEPIRTSEAKMKVRRSKIATRVDKAFDEPTSHRNAVAGFAKTVAGEGAKKGHGKRSDIPIHPHPSVNMYPPLQIKELRKLLKGTGIVPDSLYNGLPTKSHDFFF
jgi:hypothetical protein